MSNTSTGAHEHRESYETRNSEDEAFRRLVESERSAVHSHCYRMLGSLHDTEDAFQETMLRAWRGLPNYQGRSSLRTWLHRIATNVCLDAIRRRPKRVLPIRYGAPTGPGNEPPEPVREPIWIEPYPDQELGVEDAEAAPDARYEQREAVELAFMAALRHLPARQCAVLILRDVLGFSAKETASMHDKTVASINSALQRARTSVNERVPEQRELAAHAVGGQGVREVTRRYIDSVERGDIEAVVGMLGEELA